MNSYDLKCRELISERSHRFRDSRGSWDRCVKCGLMRAQFSINNNQFKYAEYNNTNFAMTINALSDDCRDCYTKDEVIIKGIIE